MTPRPATVADLLGHFAAKNVPLPRADYRLYVDEVMAGRALVLDVDGAPAVLGGVFVPDLGGPCTCWFSVVAGALSAGSLVRLVRVMRDVRDAVAPAAGTGLAAYVDDGNGAGQRIATALGFRPTDLQVGPLRRWMWPTP